MIIPTDTVLQESRSTSENIGGVTGLTEQDTRKGTKMVSLHIGMKQQLLIELA